MEITSIASSSKANCIKVSDGTTSILLDAGLPIKQLRQRLNFNLSQIDAACISHAHGDHARAAQDLADAGIDIWTSQGTIDALNLTGHRVHAMHRKTENAYYQHLIGTINVIPIELEHDAPEPVGFYLYSTVTRENLAFIPDTLFVRNTFPKLNYLLVECNFDQSLLDGNESYREMRNRITSNHMELGTLKQMLQANDLSYCKEIHLLHLSGANADSERFKREIEETINNPNIRVIIAEE